MIEEEKLEFGAVGKEKKVQHSFCGRRMSGEAAVGNADGDGAEHRQICDSKSASPRRLGSFCVGAEEEDSQAEPQHKKKRTAYFVGAVPHRFRYKKRKTTKKQNQHHFQSG